MPAHSGCARVWRTGLQPMCGTLSRCPSGSVIAASRNRTTRPAQDRRARASGPPRSTRTASAGRGRCRGTGASRAASTTTSRKPARVEAAHAVGHRALARAARRAPAPRITAGIGGDDDAALRRDVDERLRHRAQVAHSVVDDGDVGHPRRAPGRRLATVARAPLSSTARRPPRAGSRATAIRSARANALNTVSA